MTILEVEGEMRIRVEEAEARYSAEYAAIFSQALRKLMKLSTYVANDEGEAIAHAVHYLEVRKAISVMLDEMYGKQATKAIGDILLDVAKLQEDKEYDKNL